MKTDVKKRSRDVGVEIARIIGCLIVIGCHTCLPISEDMDFCFSRTFVAMCCADGVAVFWLILGFFLFQHNQDYGKLCKKMCRHIILPLFFMSVFTFYFYPFTKGATSIGECINRPLTEYVSAIKATIVWTPIIGAGHLWYLYVYALVILAFPALKGVVIQADTDRKRFGFVLIMLLLFGINVFEENNLLHCSHYSIGGLVPASIIAIIGHFLYEFKPNLTKVGYIAILVYAIINIARTFVYKLGFSYIIWWYTASGVLCASCLMCFSFRLSRLVHNNLIEASICRIASLTFPVYLIHKLVIGVLERYKITDWALGLFKDASNVAADFFYPLLMTVIVFLISLVFAFSIRLLQSCIRSMFSRRNWG